MFIAVEGNEGVGKSSLAQLLSECIPNSLVVREPGSTPLAERIREILRSGEARSPLEEFGLFLTARAALWREVVQPAIELGRPVITDRCVLSSIVYQGLLGDPDLIPHMLSLRPSRLPDAILLLDCPPQVARERRLALGAADAWDRAPLSVYRRRRQAYLDAANLLSCPVHVIDASGSIEDVASSALSALRGAPLLVS